MFDVAAPSLLSITSLQNWDVHWFFKINQDWTNGIGDFIFPILRFPKTWIPLYVALFLYMAIQKKWKVWPWVFMALVCIIVSDQLSSQVLKGLFARLRPCQDFPEKVRLLVSRCPGNASFPSSHAVNHFAIGMYFMMSLRPYWKKWVFLFPIWAISICYAQVYVGVHYPMDVLGGGLLGALIGLFIYYLFLFIFNKKGEWTKHSGDFK